MQFALEVDVANPRPREEVEDPGPTGVGESLNQGEEISENQFRVPSPRKVNES